MKRGQTTLEFVILIGFVAAGLIAMLVYVGRGHQGNVRSQADQLGARQYEPGNTRMDRARNWERKGVTKTEAMASSTTTKHSEHPVGEKNVALEAILADISAKLGEIYKLQDEWEWKVGLEAMAVANHVLGGEWPWSPTGTIEAVEDKLSTASSELGVLYTAADAARAAWPPREKDTSVSGASSMETGRITTNKSTDETLGDLPDWVKPNIR